MKIAIVHHLGAGGALRALNEMVSRLAERHECHLFTDQPIVESAPFRRVTRYAFEPLPLYGSPLGRLNQRQRWRDLMLMDAIGKEMAHTIGVNEFDVVFAHPSLMTQSPPVLSHLRVPSVYYCQEKMRVDEGLGQNRGLKGLIDQFDPILQRYLRDLRRLDRRSVANADVVLVNSVFSQDMIEDYYGRETQICYLGVDLGQFYPIEGKIERKRENMVLSVGGIQQNKGFRFLVEAISKIGEGVRPRLHLIGNSANSAELLHLNNMALVLDVNLTIETSVTEATLRERYNQASVFAYAPHNEPFGLVVLEAMACGTPVVAVNKGGFCEVVDDGETGFLVERDAVKFGATIERFLSDEGLWHNSRVNALSAVQNWQWDTVASRIEAILMETVATFNQARSLAV